MKRYILPILLSVILYACNIRNTDKIADDAPATTVETSNTTVQLIDSVYDFGNIKEGEKVTFNYRFKNTGTKPMVIKSTSASCGCTVPEKPEKPILPGETSFIKVVFNSSGKPGHNEKNINVVANTDPAFPPLVLKGQVRPS